MKNSKGSSAVAKENNQGEWQQRRWFVRQWSTTKINYSMGAASTAAKPLQNLSVGGERNSKRAGGVHNRFLLAQAYNTEWTPEFLRVSATRDTSVNKG